jgi:ADP-ribosylglycohydrolase
MTPIARARLSLEGLSVGDAFGERFFTLDAGLRIEQRAEPGGTWRWTDDTEMALSIVEELERAGAIDQDALAHAFARRFDPVRGYGAGAYRLLMSIRDGARREWLARVRDVVPSGRVRDRIEHALKLDANTPTHGAARILGSGEDVTAQDTVPFCLWIVSWFSHDFVEAMWQTVSGLGDRDTTCAIVGGIVSLQVGEQGIPEDWLMSRESLDSI